MRLYSQALAVLIACAASLPAWAETAYRDLRWRADSRFDLAIDFNGQPVNLKGELKDGEKVLVSTEDGQIHAELKSYITELFLVVAITTEAEDHGEIFLLERPNAEWLPMNRQPIRARKLALMADVEGIVDSFQKVSNFGIAQSMRKMVEYFELNPSKRLNDLYDALERGDEIVRVLPKPRGLNPGDQGIRQPEVAGVDLPPVGGADIFEDDLPPLDYDEPRPRPPRGLRDLTDPDDESEIQRPSRRGRSRAEPAPERPRRQAERPRRQAEPRARPRGEPRQERRAAPRYQYSPDMSDDYDISPPPRRRTLLDDLFGG